MSILFVIRFNRAGSSRWSYSRSSSSSSRIILGSVQTSKHALQSTGFHVFFSVLQFTINAWVVLCFSVFVFKDMMLESITSRSLSNGRKWKLKTIPDRKWFHEELLSARPQFRSLHPRLAGELKTAIDGGRVRNTIAQAEVPDLWMKHVQLNVNLEMLQNNWAT